MFNIKQLLTLNLSTHCGGIPTQRLLSKTKSFDPELFSAVLVPNASRGISVGSKRTFGEKTCILCAGRCSSMSTFNSSGNCCKTAVSTWLREEGIKSVFLSPEAGTKDSAPETAGTSLAICCSA